MENKKSTNIIKISRSLSIAGKSIFLVASISLDNKNPPFLYLVFFLLFAEKSKLNLESRCSSLRKHLSKSASELSCKECTAGSTGDSMPSIPQSPQRAKSAANPGNVASVLQRTHGFLSTLRVSSHQLRFTQLTHDNFKFTEPMVTW